METGGIGVDIRDGGLLQGPAGVHTLVIHNLIYNNAPVPTPPSQRDGPVPPCPYPGLAYFGPADAPVFFGRPTAIDRLEQAVTAHAFTALVGASGSGKSSVILAGLAPRLAAGPRWQFSYFRVGIEIDRDPFLAIARCLVPLYVSSIHDTDRLANTKALSKGLESGALSLRDVFADCRARNNGSRILLIADQFEEIFTLVKAKVPDGCSADEQEEADEALRRRFIDVLLEGFQNLAAGEPPAVSLILTLRADFYNRALAHRPLADMFQDRVENLGPMTREELTAAILKPATALGVNFEVGLVETLLDDIAEKPGRLPLLQFALREMWGLQKNLMITHQSYHNIGRVEGAIARRAETVFTELTRSGADAAMEQTFRLLFTRLVAPGQDQEDSRRVAERAELGDASWSLAQRLAGEDNRLIVTNAPAYAGETAEVIHEALIRRWPKLVNWIERDRAFIAWRLQIKPAADAWAADRTDEGPLLRGGILAQAEDWLRRRKDELTLLEGDFVNASIDRRAKEEAEREAQRQAELERETERADDAARLAKAERAKAYAAQALAEASERLATLRLWTTRVAVVGILISLGLSIFMGRRYYEIVSANKCDVLAGEPDNDIGIPGVNFEHISQDIAIKTCRSAVINYPGNIRFYHNLGRAYDAAGNYSNAVEWYQKAAEFRWPWSQNNLAVLYLYGRGVQIDWVKSADLFVDTINNRNAGLAATKARENYYDRDLAKIFEDNESLKSILQNALDGIEKPIRNDYHRPKATLYTRIDNFKKLKNIKDQGISLNVLAELGVLQGINDILRRKTNIE